MANFAQDSATIQDVLDEAEACDIKISAARLALGRIGPASRAFASLVALAERSSVMDVSLGVCWGRWCATLEFNSGDILDAVADSPRYRSSDSAWPGSSQPWGSSNETQVRTGLMEDT